MNDAPYPSLEAVIQDRAFPDVDLALRRGRHIGLDDTEMFTFLVDTQQWLEPFYRRYSCELILVTDSYFYLLPSGSQLGQRKLTRAEMLVGQALALMYLDPATLKASGVAPVAQLLELLTSLVGQDRLIAALNARRSRTLDLRIAEETVRKEVTRAVRGLERLGFLTRLSDDELRLRSPLMRFADPVRGLSDPALALEQLLKRGEVVLENESDPTTTEDDADRDDESDDLNDEQDDTQDAEDEQ